MGFHETTPHKFKVRATLQPESGGGGNALRWVGNDVLTKTTREFFCKGPMAKCCPFC